MSAVLCGSKRTYFDDIPSSSPTSSPVSSKRLRCSSTSPVRFPPQFPSAIDQLRSFFPLMDSQLLERVLEQCGNDMDAAIKRLQELHLGSVEENQCSPQEMPGPVERAISSINGVPAASENVTDSNDLPVDGAGWVELLVREMSAAITLDDAKARAARALEMLEKSITSRAGAEATINIQKENQMLKGQIEGLIRENSILKRAVGIQHERQKEYDERNQELQNLKQLVAQYQEQIRTLEINNYALSMHLERAQKNSSFPGGFNPDIF